MGDDEDELVCFCWGEWMEWMEGWCLGEACECTCEGGQIYGPCLVWKKDVAADTWETRAINWLWEAQGRAVIVLI